MTALIDSPAVTPDMQPQTPDWMYEPAVMSARQESMFARLSWEKVAPADGQLPEGATPLQRLLHARMVTSDFAYEVVLRAAMRRE